MRVRLASVGEFVPVDGNCFVVSSRRRHTRLSRDWSSDVCSSDLYATAYAKGYAEGRAAGATEASRLVRDTTLAVDRYLAKLEGEIGALALGVVRRVLGDLDIAEVVTRAAGQALAEFRQERFVKVTFHPAAVDRVSTA